MVSEPTTDTPADAEAVLPQTLDADDLSRETELPSRIDAVQPDSLIMVHDTLTNALFYGVEAPDGSYDCIINQGAIGLPVRKDLAIPVDIVYDDPAIHYITVDGTLPPYCRLVNDAVISIYRQYGLTLFTVKDIARLISGGQDHFKPSLLQLIDENMWVLNRTVADINATAELKGSRWAQELGVTEFKKKGSLINIESVEFTLRNGIRVSGYRLLSEPLLYWYAKLKGQLTSVPPDMLVIYQRVSSTGLSGRLPSTPSRQLLETDLLRRIRAIQNAARNHRRKKGWNTILFKTVFWHTGLDSLPRQRLQRCREFLLQCLDTWQHRGEFESYTVIKEGRQIKGVKIELQMQEQV